MIEYRRAKSEVEYDDVISLQEEIKPLKDNTIGGIAQFVVEGVRGYGPHVWTKTLPEGVGYGAIGGCITGLFLTLPGLPLDYLLRKTEVVKEISSKIKNDYVKDLSRNYATFFAGATMFAMLGSVYHIIYNGNPEPLARLPNELYDLVLLPALGTTIRKVGEVAYSMIRK